MTLAVPVDPAPAAPTGARGRPDVVDPTGPGGSTGPGDPLPSDAPPAAGRPARPRLPRRVWATLGLAGVPALAFVLACTVYDAPPSAAQARLRQPVADVLEPYFWQDWQLFAPSPGAVDPQVRLQTRLRRPDGQVVETAPVEVEGAVDRLPRGARLNPTKLPGIFLSLNGSASRYAQAEGRIDKLPAAQRQQAQHALDEGFANSFTQLQRFMSARAEALYPDDQVLAVRVTFGNRAIVPFSQRYVSPAPSEPFQEALQTSWMAFVPGVAR